MKHRYEGECILFSISRHPAFEQTPLAIDGLIEQAGCQHFDLNGPPFVPPIIPQEDVGDVRAASRIEDAELQGCGRPVRTQTLCHGSVCRRRPCKRCQPRFQADEGREVCRVAKKSAGSSMAPETHPSDRSMEVNPAAPSSLSRARLKNMFSAFDWLVEGRGVRRPVATATTRSECLWCRRIAANTLQEHLIATLTAPRLHECSISHRMTSLPSAPASNPFLRQCLGREQGCVRSQTNRGFPPVSER